MFSDYHLPDERKTGSSTFEKSVAQVSRRKREWGGVVIGIGIGKSRTFVYLGKS